MRMARPGDKPPHFIRQWRKKKGLTLEQLAERVGMTHQNLGKIERFKVPYSQPLLEALADVLGTDPGSLVMRNPEDPEGLWSIYDQLSPPEREEAVALITVLRARRAKL